MVSYETAPREYFQSVIEEMKNQGFEFMAWVTMNSQRNKYHVDCFGYSQESRLFFRAPQKAFIVMLELTEHFGHRGFQIDGPWDEDYRQVYWSGHIDYAYSRRRWLEAEGDRRFASDDPYSEKGADYRLERLAFDCLELEGSTLRWFTSSRFEQRDTMDPNRLDPTELTAPFGEMLKVLEPWLYPRFKRLQVTDFAPHYTFPGQEADFWAKFPLGRLQHTADTIWGSVFMGRR